jgi:hypothetical protein
MIILLLCEPRSGSTNLAHWFNSNKNFTVLQEPLNKESIDYKKGEPIGEWMYDTEHFLIKEIYFHNNDLTELINLSDKIILLYRENDIEQLESWLVAIETKQWISEWVSNRVKIRNQQDKENYFYSLKNGFENEYLNEGSFFKISYEELYYNNGFQKILDYLDIAELENKNFPYGLKYRINIDGVRSLI